MLERIDGQKDKKKSTVCCCISDYFEIKIKGHLYQRWSSWFTGMKLTEMEGGETDLYGPLPDQAALHGLLERIRDLNLALISVNSCSSSTQQPDKE